MKVGMIALAAFGAATCANAAAETLHCRPDPTVFCANLHVGCAGRSTIASPDFTIRFTAAGALVQFEGAAAIEVDVSESHAGRVLRVGGGRDWIRVDPSRRFSRRIYRGGRALMSIGRCAYAAQ